MTNPVARVGDVVTGYCDGPGHVRGRPFVGVWPTGSGTVVANGVAVIRVGDTGVTDCGHTFIAQTGSDITTDTGIPIHRVGDVVATEGGGVGVTVTGSDTVTSD